MIAISTHAIRYGGHLVIGVFEATNEANTDGLLMQIDDFRRAAEAIDRER